MNIFSQIKQGAKLSVVIAAAAVGSFQAHAESTMHVTVAGVLDSYTPNVDSSTTADIKGLASSSSIGIGGGVLFEGSFVSPIGFETGLLYVHRKNEYKTSSVAYNQGSNWLQVPFGLKFRFAEIISVGAGAYIGYRLGSPSNDFSLGNSTLAGYNSSNNENFELGFYASAGVTFPVSESMGIVLDLRYLRGVSNLSEDTAVNIKSADLMLLAGVQFRY